MPSPKNSAAPKIPSVTSSAPWTTLLRCSKAVSAMIPPSPRLWARMMKPAYLIDTTTISAQKINDAIPYTVAGVICAVALYELKMACSVYSGLVPMSPYTTPSAPSTRTARPALAITSRLESASASNRFRVASDSSA